MRGSTTGISAIHLSSHVHIGCYEQTGSYPFKNTKDNNLPLLLPDCREDSGVSFGS